MDPEPAIAYEDTFDALYGLELGDVSDERVTGTVAVRDAVKQPMGLVHGGVFASIAESLASLATARSVMSDGMFATGQSNQTNFLRPTPRARSTPPHCAATAAARAGSGTSRSPTTPGACAP